MAYADDMMAAEPEQEPSVSPVEFVQFVASGENLVAEIDESEVKRIGREAVEGYEDDKDSMSDWLDANKEAIKLAKLVKDDKNYPFKGASNIKYPLLTSAALQFNARAYPAIVPSTDVVKAKIWGPDKEGQKAARGKRVSSFMTYQLLCEIEEWEHQMDSLLVQLPIANDLFRKVWYDGERTRTKLIDAGALILNIKAESLEIAPRVSEEFELFPHEIAERERTGWFVEIDYQTNDDDEDPQEFIEQHCRLDLDEDGYPEPYIVTVHCGTSEVVRLVADFDENDVRFKMGTQDVEQPAIVPDAFGQPMQVMQVVQQEVPTGIEAIKRNHYFVHYQFMPAMDNCLLGMGLGALLGDISKSVNTTINMLIDSGHYASLGGGFIGSEFRVKGGSNRMAPGEYRLVQNTGDDVRKAIVEKTFPGPNSVMFEMLGLLIDAGKEISSTKDIITGENASNMPATTAMALVEQGQRVFTAAYKRIFRALKKEFKLLADINARYLDPQRYQMFLEEPADPQQDFSAADMDLTPVADPSAVTKSQEMAKAQLIMDLAGQGMADPQAAGARVMEAASIDDIEELLPKPPPPEMQQAQQMDMQLSLALKQITVGKAQADTQKVAGEIEKLRAEIMEIVAGVENDKMKTRLDAISAFIDQQRTDVQQAIEVARLVNDANKRTD